MLGDAFERMEGRFIQIPLLWNTIEEFIIRKIENMPKDARIVNVNHRPELFDSMITVYSPQFDKTEPGTYPPSGSILYTYDKNTKMVLK